MQIHRHSEHIYISNISNCSIIIPLNQGDLVTGISIFEFQRLYSNTNYTAYYDQKNQLNIVVL